jgi:hypothetical protein
MSQEVDEKACAGVAPHSYSGSESQSMIRARGNEVTLLYGIISEESPKTHADPCPIFLTSPARVRLLHRTSIFLSSPVMPILRHRLSSSLRSRIRALFLDDYRKASCIIMEPFKPIINHETNRSTLSCCYYCTLPYLVH